MRIGVLSDIHGNLAALEAVVRDLAGRGADAVVNLGDHLSGPLLPLETAQCLMAKDWVHIAGNHERQILTQGPGEWGPSDAYTHSALSPRELAWLASMPSCRALQGDLLLCHGTPAWDLEYLLETVEPPRVRLATPAEIEARLDGEKASLVLCGHSHVPRSVRTAGGQVLVNPGSVGLPAFEDTGPVPHVVETGSPDARYAILEGGTRGWTASLVSVPYDHRSMARLARRRGRPDWERPLLHGYMT